MFIEYLTSITYARVFIHSSNDHMDEESRKPIFREAGLNKKILSESGL